VQFISWLCILICAVLFFVLQFLTKARTYELAQGPESRRIQVFGMMCRMDLSVPTISVGTRTDYSVGPWDYPA
jgi:hypothetical protein